MRIQHNIMAMNAYRNYTNNVSAMKANLEKLSSGYKINRAGDDAAGLAISEKMRAQITGLETAQKNAKDGISLVQTAEGALTEVHDMLNRMVELATQSANGTYDNTTDRAQLQKEMDQLKEEINRIADSSNFNGIKLLDGSLSTSGVDGSSTIKIGGNVNADYSVGAAGKYTTSVALTAGCFSAGAEGDEFSYTVSLEDGTSYTATLTLQKDSNGDLKKLVSSSGSTYSIASAGTATVAELDSAILSELQKTNLANDYVVTSDGAGKFTFTAKTEGTSTAAVASADFAWTVNSTGVRAAGTAVGITVDTAARDVGYEIQADKITEYDGTNYDDAVFTINGKKFVLLTNTIDGSTTGTNDEYLRAVQSLGSDVTVLVGGRGGLKDGGTGAPGQTDAANGNFSQNIAKIAEVTGLNVTAGVSEAGGNTGATTNTGIRLSAGKGSATGGLVLQIGDTADSYNQLRVSINDCHTKSLGLDDISIAEQGDAQSAIDAIKNAINYVSDVRGTLGATQNRLDHTINNLSVMTENIQDAESTIRDTDVAEEMMAYTKNNILIQSAQAMLAQANQVPQGVLQLLQ